MPRPQATFRVFELLHVGGEWDELPAYVGAGTTDPGWLARWRNRDLDPSRLGVMFRELAERGLTPKVDQGLLPRRPVQYFVARGVVRARVEAIRAIAHGHPDWLLNPRPQKHLGGGTKVGASPRPVVRVTPSGETTRHPTLSAAAAATGIPWSAIQALLTSGQPDVDGCLWFDDDGAAGFR